ncbi:20334_t:CDS:2 [Cetraspora pellucida]|uniref:20334_t:CDS:1 n=1 Tax=Cetraspora pellucida TaxID=1433469 RepID=A0A9N9NSM1_9GLOM|nr:20334_t:CDS:2 [Cetraspora pellucida]
MFDILENDDGFGCFAQTLELRLLHGTPATDHSYLSRRYPCYRPFTLGLRLLHGTPATDGSHRRTLLIYKKVVECIILGDEMLTKRLNDIEKNASTRIRGFQVNITQ